MLIYCGHSVVADHIADNVVADHIADRVVADHIAVLWQIPLQTVLWQITLQTPRCVFSHCVIIEIKVVAVNEQFSTLWKLQFVTTIRHKVLFEFHANC
jgi:hypothetical protein